MTDAPVLQWRQGDIARLTLNKPAKGNALDAELVVSLNDNFDAVIRDGARIIFFGGAGRDFCTGFDLSDLEAQSDGDLLQRFVAIEIFLQKLSAAPIVTVALGSGRAFGAGADLFAACDRRVAFQNSVYAFPGPAFGLVLGTARLASRIGRHEARNILLSGKQLSADDAVAIGLATERFDDEDTTSLVEHLSRSAARLDKETVSAIHRVTRHDNSDVDLAELVRSAARPGLKQRIIDYREKMRLAFMTR